MESPGEYLKREREHRGVSLLKIFESTRVPMKYLEALEDDRIEGMPHPTFVKGYIRSYCKVLGVDENDAVLRFEVWMSEKNAEAEEAGRPKTIQEIKKAKAGAPAKPKMVVKIPANLGKVVVISAGIIIVILAYVLTKRDLSAPEPQLSPAPAIQAAAEPSPSIEPVQPPAPVAQAPLTAPEAAVSSAKAQSAPAVQAAPPLANIPAVSAKPVQQPQVKPVQQTVPQAPPQAEPPKKEAPANGALTETPKNHILTANARDMVWLKVGIDKAEPVEVLLKQGERITWTASDNISVIIGNAGGVTLTYNGKAIGGLGSQGEVVGLKLPSGTSYKIKKPQPQVEIPAQTAPEAPAPQVAPAVNMPEPPAAGQGASGE